MDTAADIYLIGECHTSEGHAQTQEKIIADRAPDVVLREGFNDRDWEDLQDDLTHVGRTYSLDHLEETIREEYGIDTAMTDDIYDDIAATPWPDLDPADILTLADVAEDTARDLAGTDGEDTEDCVSFLETAAEKYRLYHDVKQSPSSTAVHRTMYAVHELRGEGKDTQIRGCDIDKRGYVDGMDEDEIKEAFFSDELIELREQVMADRIGESARDTDLVVGIIGRYHRRAVETRLEEDGFTVDGGVMRGDPGRSAAYQDSLLSQYR